MKSVLEFLTYFEGVKKEFKYIKFLSKKEVYQISLLVLVCVVIFSFAFSMLDLIVSNLIKLIIGF